MSESTSTAESSAAAPASTPARESSSGATAFPEPALLIRQGANIQGPFKMSRIRGYVAQRRIQPYMLFSMDGVFWLGAEHIPGLIPEGYVPVPPAARPSVVPEMPVGPDGRPLAGAAVPAPAPAPTPQPGADTGSITLVGYRLDQRELAPPTIPASRPVAPPVPRPQAPPFPGSNAAPAPSAPSYYVRQNGRDVYGPFPESVIRDWITEGRVTPDNDISTDGRNWVPGSRMPGLFGPTRTSRVPGSRSQVEEVVEEDPPRRRFGFRGRR